MFSTAWVWSCTSSPSRFMMPKARPKSQSKSRKRSPAKGKFAAMAPMEERNSAAETVKEQKPLSHTCRKFFLLLLSALWNLGRKHFSFGPSEKKKEPSLEGPDAASSSSALAAPCGASVAAKRASEEQTEGPTVERLSLGTVNENDPCQAPNSTGSRNEAWTPVPEDIEAVISSDRVMVGGIVRVGRVGYQKKEEPEVHSFERLHEIEEDEIKSERPGSDSGYWKKKHDDLKEKYKVFDKTVVLRQVFSDFEKTKEFVVMNDEIKEEVLKLLKRETVKTGKNFKMIVRKTLYTKILRTMHFQRVNMALKSSFWNIDWRKDHRFPTFTNNGDDYKWWEQNYDPKILEKRLGILREAAKKWNSERDIFMVIELITELNWKLHPQTSEKERVEMFRLATTIHSLSSGGDSEI